MDLPTKGESHELPRASKDSAGDSSLIHTWDLNSPDESGLLAFAIANQRLDKPQL